MFLWNHCCSLINLIIHPVKEQSQKCLLTVVDYVQWALPDSIKKSLLNGINYSIDWYIDFKYRNYDQSKNLNFDQIPYVLTKIQLQNMHSSEIFDLSTSNINLRSDQILLNDNYIQNLSKIQLDQNLVVKIHFEYNHQEYIFPIQYSIGSNMNITLPLYLPDDIDSCCKVEYEKIVGDGHPIDESLTETIMKHAGPKGNFYCDTPYKMTPKLIIDDIDRLQLTTVLGQDYEFNASTPIIIDN